MSNKDGANPPRNVANRPVIVSPRNRPTVVLPSAHPALVPEAGHIQRFETLDGRPVESLFGKLFAQQDAITCSNE